MGILSKILEKSMRYLAFEKDLRILLITSIILSLGVGLWEPLFGLYVTNNLGIPLIMFGLMTTVRQLVTSLVSFPSGFLSDNFGRRNMIMLSILFSIFSIISLFFVEGLPWLFIISIFQGLSMAFIGPSKSAYVTDVIPDARRGRAYATLALFQSLSNIIAISIAGIIVGVFDFYLIFSVALSLEIISLAGTTLYLKESLGREIVEIKPSKEPIFKQFKQGLYMLKNPPLFAVLLGIIFHQLGLGIQMPYLTIFTHNVLLFSLPTISLMLGIQRLGIFFGHFPSGRIVDKYGGEISFAFHICVTSPVMILFVITGNPFFASLLLFLWGLTFGLDNVSRQKLIAKYKSESGIATAFGVISLIAGVISLISPIIGAWIWTNFSPQTVFYTSAVVNFVGSLPLVILWLYTRNGKVNSTNN